MVAGVRFERTSKGYEPFKETTPPSRNNMVLETGVEPVRSIGSQDFKSGVSANSTIPARWLHLRDSNPEPLG